MGIRRYAIATIVDLMQQIIEEPNDFEGETQFEKLHSALKDRISWDPMEDTI